ncbi:hypothetical protein LEUCIP111803_02400 [Leucobacter soli]|uniref:Ig-like domain-containing protein n=2 Tax=Leucobacter soli TaxID=2812850 RepID=A0A916NIZ7_9MICO|nr:HtaA domain-containing protein [Leucobacter soli]CAG7620942.1 hypothetical protein LEUCIP111803_02400 [Leucobacter soli]
MSRHAGLRAIMAAAVTAFVVAGSALAAPSAFAEDAVPQSTVQSDAGAQSEGAESDAPAEGDALPAAEEDPGAEPAAPAETTAPDEDGAADDSDSSSDVGTGADAQSSTQAQRARSLDEPEAIQTSIALTPAKATIDHGGSVTLTATVTPVEVTGTVTLLDDQHAIGDPETVVDGAAVFTLDDLTVGTHRLSAGFLPDDADAYSGAASDTIEIRVIGEAEVEGAKLTWGVKASFRNYIYNFTSFKGRAALLGDARQPAAKGVYVWPNGSGTVKTDGSAADVTFGAADGVHFQSHPMTIGGKSVYALDMTFTKPRIVITSPTTGELRMDAAGYEFKSMTEVGAPYLLENALIATLRLPTPTKKGTTFTWTDAAATLTSEGAIAFGEFYEPGETLDPVTFSLPADGEIVVKEQTKTKLSATPKKATKGKKVTFTASVSPKLAGTVTFTYAGKQLGKPVSVKKGKASLATTSLPVGIHSVRASFSPKDDSTYGHSVSNAVDITVLAKQAKTKKRTTPSSGSAEGSLLWSVSDKFTAYTTCDGKEAYGMSHCAKGSVSTSGVGSGYLFPQASATKWNARTQTGTVAYSGRVTFTGYGQTMFQVLNPSITVTGPNSATLHTGNTTAYGAASYRLDLGNASKTVGAGGEVTWSGVAVIGSMSSGGAGGSGSQSIGFDSLSFTVGATSSKSFGSSSAGTDETQRTPAETAPASTGITVLTDADRLRPGGRIEIEASGFEANETGILVVLYSEPILLDDAATADANGVVRWSGTLPKGLSGEHTITLQGSVDAGAVIDLAETDDGSDGAGAANGTPTAVEAQSVQAAGLAAAPAPGMGLWEWWASAAGLVLIAACTTTLAVRQRRRAAA